MMLLTFANYYRLFHSVVLLRFCYHFSDMLYILLPSVRSPRPVEGPARDRLRQKPHRCARA